MTEYETQSLNHLESISNSATQIAETLSALHDLFTVFYWFGSIILGYCILKIFLVGKNEKHLY